MRTAALVAAFAIVAGVFCDGKPAVKQAQWPKEAFGTLTEADIAEFVRLLPRFDGALKAAGWKNAPAKAGEGPDTFLASMAESMNVPGVDDSLQAAGSSWGAMRSLMYRILPAMTAVQIDKTPPGMVEAWKKDTSAAAKQGLKRFEDTKAALSQIPSANRELVSNHVQELMAFQRLGR